MSRSLLFLLGWLLLMPAQDLGQGPARALSLGAGQSNEIARVREHLLGAERLLLARDPRSLGPRQRMARERCLDELRAYRARGVFPHNHQLPDRRTPVFVDEHGTRCAMAWLIECSGEAELVRRIAATRNLASIHALADEPELVAWLDRNGLALEEAARIQPTYGPSPSLEDAERRHAVVGGIGAAVGGLGAGLNLVGASSGTAGKVRCWVGVAMGLSGAAMGLPALEHEGGVRAIGVLDVGLGLVSTVLGLRQLHSAPAPRPLSSAGMWTPAIWRDEQGTQRVALTARF